MIPEYYGSYFSYKTDVNLPAVQHTNTTVVIDPPHANPSAPDVGVRNKVAFENC